MARARRSNCQSFGRIYLRVNGVQHERQILNSRLAGWIDRYITRCRKPLRLPKFGSCDTLGLDIPSRQDWGSPPVGSWEVDMALSHRAPKLVALLAAACTGLLV